mmetsp:Transcript_46654/g.53001  ORF Transcript_46654/g.53001 Transcript_46654/m.53001 type:complete len:591 (-) Transcript_46654:49-1821(-)
MAITMTMTMAMMIRIVSFTLFSSTVKYSDAFSLSLPSPSSISSSSSSSSSSSLLIYNYQILQKTSVVDNSNTNSALFASSSTTTNNNNDDNFDENDDIDDDEEDEDNEEKESKKNKMRKQEEEDAAERWKIQAQELREQIKKMEDNLSEQRPNSGNSIINNIRSSSLKYKETELEATLNELTSKNKKSKEQEQDDEPPASILDGKRILVVGANGRLGSMVCRKLLRTYPEIKEVIAMVHIVGENSMRGYGRLSYEVGAEDGRGTISPAWSLNTNDDEPDQTWNTQRFEYDEEVMAGHNLQKLRVVECEVLDPLQCTTIMDDAQPDIIVWCASDFNGNIPRAISGGSGPLSSLPFLFRAVASPDKGRCEIEGLYNIVGALKKMKQETIQRERRLSAFDNNDNNNNNNKKDDDDSNNDNNKTQQQPVDVLIVSICPDALGDFETPFGRFLDIKRQGEDMIPTQFPSLTYSVLQFAQYEDNFVKEDLELKCMVVEKEAPRIVPSIEQQQQQQGSNNSSSFYDAITNPSLSSSQQQEKGEEEEETTPTTNRSKKTMIRRINRRDAARAVTEALIDPDFRQKKIQVWTNEVGGSK